MACSGDDTPMSTSSSDLPSISSLVESANYELYKVDEKVSLRIYSSSDLHQAIGMKMIKTIGRGASGDVILVRSEEHPEREIAIKRFNCRLEHMNIAGTSFTDEILTTRELNHPHIVKDLIPAVFPRYLAFFMEYYPLLDLSKHIKSLTNDRKQIIFIQLACAVRYMHNMHIVHRDIKPGNLMMKAPDHIVLSDFGLARRVLSDQPLFGGLVGTPKYMAPEVRDFRYTHQKYDGILADAYSCGAVLWAILMEKPPDENTNLLGTLIESAHCMEPCLFYCAKELLQEIHNKRKTIKELLDVLPGKGYYCKLIDYL